MDVGIKSDSTQTTPKIVMSTDKANEVNMDLVKIFPTQQGITGFFEDAAIPLEQEKIIALCTNHVKVFALTVGVREHQA